MEAGFLFTDDYLQSLADEARPPSPSTTPSTGAVTPVTDCYVFTLEVIGEEEEEAVEAAAAAEAGGGGRGREGAEEERRRRRRGA